MPLTLSKKTASITVGSVIWSVGIFFKCWGIRLKPPILFF